MPDFPRSRVIVKTFGHPRAVYGLTPTYGVEPPFSLTYKRRGSSVVEVIAPLGDEPKTRYERPEVV